MSAMRGVILTTFFSIGLMSAAYADDAVAPTAQAFATQVPQRLVAPVPAKRHVLFRPQVVAYAKPHDASRPVTHIVRLEGREAASPSLHRASSIGTPERVATLLSRAACDSLLCPGYAMIGVGF